LTVFKRLKIDFISLCIIVLPIAASARGIDPGPDFTMDVPSGGALAGNTPRIFITTDPLPFENPDEFDDLQSLIETMLFADVLDIEGIAATITEPVFRIINAYERDLPNLQTYSSTYPTAAFLRSIVTDINDDGVNLLIQAARKSSDRPLYVLSWGPPTTLAQALRIAPDIATNIRIIMIGDSNVSNNAGLRESFTYLYSQRHRLWWILMDNGFTGVHIDPVGLRASLPVEEHFSKFEFPHAHASGHGHLGNLFAHGINWSRVGIAEQQPHFRSGDLPSLLYLLRGNPDVPEAEHWGGHFQKVIPLHGPSYQGGASTFWTDVMTAEASIWPNSVENPWRESIPHDSQRSVIKYHMQFMPEIAARYDRAKNPQGVVAVPLDPLKFTNRSNSIQPAPQPDPDPDPAPQPQPVPAPDPVPQPEPEAEAAPEVDTQPTQPAPSPESLPGPVVQSDPVMPTAPETETQPDVQETPIVVSTSSNPDAETLGGLVMIRELLGLLLLLLVGGRSRKTVTR